MIPAPIFSGTFFIVLGISFLATVSVLVWAAALALFPRARRSFRTHRVRATAILAALCVMSSFFVFMATIWLRVDLNMRKEEAARHPTLEKGAHLLGIDMPPGTRLSLYTAGDMKSIERAEFPHAVGVYGIPAVAVEIVGEYDDETSWNNLSPVWLTALKLTVTGTPTIDGWTCGASEPLEIVLRNDARIRTLWSCRLADGNRVAGAIVPARSRLMRSTTAYGDGLRDNDYWEIRVADGAVFELPALPLLQPTLKLDREHNILAFDYATLARAASIGDITYPAGTEVVSGVRGLRENYPGAWLFKTVHGRHAVSNATGPIADGASVVQAPSGKVYALFPHKSD
ncbi:hypothetical protein HT746_15880 [Burkholderia pyrrocinia]|uniref:hypothetical protein n=1 Tax=Burkholderia pyrrocinia TaxID=60550 RepID=UPI0015770A60|nr:hypothetical protein [Burkholderia pyrrocinia]NTX28590.1 hypothetical protein [Burkholderia pyrrocinia]